MLDRRHIADHTGSNKQEQDADNSPTGNEDSPEYPDDLIG